MFLPKGKEKFHKYCADGWRKRRLEALVLGREVFGIIMRSNEIGQ
jgi:hypothetical protein